MTFDFDQVFDRHNTGSTKWSRYPAEVLPMWVADMDFAAPPVVIDALQRRIAHGVFGYTEAWPSLVEAVVEGLQREHAWTIEPDWLVWLPGVVSGFNLACAIAGEVGDGVVTATPVYPPFLSAPANTGRVLQRCELVLRAGRWQWDWEALERAVDARSRLLLLCSPHNPVGRVFDADELRELADFAARQAARRASHKAGSPRSARYCRKGHKAARPRPDRRRRGSARHNPARFPAPARWSARPARRCRFPARKPGRDCRYHKRDRPAHRRSSPGSQSSAA